MKNILKLNVVLIFLLVASCKKDFLNKNPLNAPSDATFWTSEKNATLWVNNLYRILPQVTDFYFDTMSDDTYGSSPGADGGAGYVANGTFDPTYAVVKKKWDYTYLRSCYELLEKIDQVPGISATGKSNLTGQTRFIIAFRYFEMITLYRDIPFFTKVLSISESDLPKTEKSVILKYILEQLDIAINDLPVSWPASDIGRATKGAALTLKARVLLYNERWAEAAAAAKAVMDLNVYQLHPKFNELFLSSFNNKTKEVILAYQYAANLNTHNITFLYPFYNIGGIGASMPLPDLVNAYESKDGLPITKSPLYDPLKPFDNRDPRFYETFIYPFQSLAGVVYDPINNAETKAQAKTYIYPRKYIADMFSQQRTSYVNWIIFRYADLLLMYAEAKNEAGGPDNSIYDALDLVRLRAGMPKADRTVYNTKENLREFIRNERRVELACEGLRYYDIIRWKIADKVLNKTIVSLTIPGVLPLQTIETRVFNPAKNYVWPIPQSAIDNSKNLVQHTEWK